YNYIICILYVSRDYQRHSVPTRLSSDLDVRAIAAKMPPDRIIVETDCPYLAPVPFRGRRCDPEHVVHVVDKLAEILTMPRDEIERMTTQNFFRLFSKAQFRETSS